MRFSYSTTHPSHTQLDSMPRLPLTLKLNNLSIDVFGLVDSGATINVLPFSVGQQLGAIWDSQKAVIRLAGNMANALAQPIIVKAEIGNFPPVSLAFAWVAHNNTPTYGFLIKHLSSRNPSFQRGENSKWLLLHLSSIQNITSDVMF